jgi:DNA invertase Pin-like site-specific DNA recombinase
MRKVAGYVRVSSEELSREGISLDAQRARIEAYCAMRSLELVELVEDPGVSASRPLRARAGGQRLLELLRRRRIAGVVAFKLDRLFRNCADCWRTSRCGTARA